MHVIKKVDFPKKELRNDKSFYALSNIKKLNKFHPPPQIFFICVTYWVLYF